GGTGERVGRGRRGRGPRGGNDERIDELNGQRNGQGLGVNGNVEGVNGCVRGAPDFSTIIVQQLQNLLLAILAQVGNQGNVRNQNGNVVNENVINVLVNGNWVGCSYKEFLACNPEEYDGFNVWNSQIRTLSQEVAVSMSWNDFKLMMIEEFCPSHEMQKLETELWNHVMVKANHAAYTDRFHELARLVPHLISGALTDEAVRNGSIKKVKKQGNVREPSKDKNGHLARDCKVVPRNVNPVNVRNPTPACGACHECGSTDHFRPACPRLNRARGPGGNRPNQAAANNEGQGRGNQGNQARGIEPSELGFRYEIEIASGQLVEIDKVEIEGHVFDIDLIPFGHGCFDVIIGMDWLSNHKAKIICHEKVVRIPLLDDKVLRVLGERPEEKARLLMSTKNRDKKQEEIVVVRDFPEVFLDDLSGLPPLWEIEFWIELIPGAVPVAKSPYRLTPSELEEFSGQLKELQDKGFI
ncbi:putative reverse transcriptase domain-containing protein, partial [Tanacetum coccineum]